ncbi:aminomethyltransferase, mitochondrial-like [Teleopsis dalmanni]|uniref:aminomethyltransferase, mitochondrial-like n=1 Tax=Teleopsis dalmanni TaxID=139649 RepID=UPI0018CF2E23|nr:aminomethyltransferase, mitochondrial-like [Teleopsis dalmanni]
MNKLQNYFVSVTRQLTGVSKSQFQIKNYPLAAVQNNRSYSAESKTPERTALYDFHVKNNGKIVNFGGYALPVQYADQSIKASHLHTRKFGSIFDVSHMLQTYVHGKHCISCIESICTADLKGIKKNGRGTLTVFTNENGGILDDLIIMKLSDECLYIVSNAAMKEQDMQIMENAVSNYKSDRRDVSIEFLTPTDQSLIAVQGPTAVAAIAKLLPKNINMDEVKFMETFNSELAGIPNCRITRCGYTGEDGIEISVPSTHVQQLTEALLNSNTEAQLKLAGLGARDSLRLEAGLCLYGKDINNKTTPIEADLTWLVAKRRRAELNYPGAHTVQNQIATGVSKRRAGLLMLGGSDTPPARTDAQIYHNEELIGQVTSGCPSPSLCKNVAMGYIDNQFAAAGTNVQLKIRNKLYAAEVVKMPFIKTNYFVKSKK